MCEQLVPRLQDNLYIFETLLALEMLRYLEEEVGAKYTG